MHTFWGTAAQLFHKGLPLIKVVLLMYGAAICALWASVRLLAPGSNAFSFLRGVGATFILAVAGNSFHRYLGPVMGGWYLLIALASYVFIVKVSFSMPLWRSALTALIYFGVVAVAYHVLVMGLIS